MIDSFLKSKNEAALMQLHANMMNVIGPIQGRAEQEITQEDGTVETIAAAGDPAYWYVAVRAPFPVPAYGDIEEANVETCRAVCGVWS